jgi:hypothetical protein
MTHRQLTQKRFITNECNLFIDEVNKVYKSTLFL